MSPAVRACACVVGWTATRVWALTVSEVSRRAAGFVVAGGLMVAAGLWAARRASSGESLAEVPSRGWGPDSFYPPIG